MVESNESHIREPLKTIEEAADFLNISSITLRRYIKAGKIEAYKIAGQYRFAPNDLLRFLEGHRVNPKGERVG